MPDLDLDQLVLRNARDLVALDFDITSLFRTRVHGVEVTQAIQYFDAWRHLTDAADRGPDNSVTIVSRKPAIARVYVRSGFRRPSTTVTGSLEVRKRIFGFRYVTVATLSPMAPGNVSAFASPGYAAERGNLTSTLNFLLPADLLCGHLRLVVRIAASDGATDEETVDVDATLRQTLRLRSIPIGYNGPSSTAAGAPTITVAAPTLANLQTTSGWALNAFPVEATGRYSATGAITWNRPLSDAPSCAGCCTPNWVALNAQVAAQVTADGNRTNVIYYGLIATGVPMGPIVGCESSGVSSGSVGDGVTMAHELGHHCGMPHAPCGGVGTPDATYPAYEPYDPGGTRTASIGEYGTNVLTGAVMSPATFKDMMSYCGPRWISLHNYGRLINEPLLDPRRECVDHWWWRDVVLQDRVLIPEKWLPDPPPDGRPPTYTPVVGPEPLVSVIGVLHGPDELEVTSVMQLETRRGIPAPGATGLVLEALDREGEVLGSVPVQVLRSLAGTGQDGSTSGCGCGGGCAGSGGGAGGSRSVVTYPCVVQAFLPPSPDAQQLRVRRGRTELWSRERPEGRPSTPTLKAALREGRLALSWRAEDRDAEVWAQWSSDGEVWNALATDLAGGEGEVDASSLPAGRVQVRVLVGDGFGSRTSKPVSVRVPRQAPSLAVLSPSEDQTFAAGLMMRLWGSLADPAVDPDELGRVEAVWTVDGEAAGEGLDAFVQAPPAGEHEAVLEVRSPGGPSTASVRFRTISLEEDPPEPATAGG